VDLGTGSSLLENIFYDEYRFSEFSHDIFNIKVIFFVALTKPAEFCSHNSMLVKIRPSLGSFSTLPDMVIQFPYASMV
jgi:hypothetical protein